MQATVPYSAKSAPAPALGSLLPEPPGSPNRLRSLDGLRGIAALIVACHHYCCAFVPRLIPELTPHPYWIAKTPFEILVNGAFSVSVFFVLSGFVVARAASRSRDRMISNLVFRYLRLALPVVACVVFAWMLLEWIPDAATRLNAVRPSPWLSITVQHTIPSFIRTLFIGFLGVFGFDVFHHTRDAATLNNVLWTMRIELDGSAAIYVYYGVRRKWLRYLVLALLAVETVRRPVFVAFLLGAGMMECWSKGRLQFRHGAAAMAIGVLLGFPADTFTGFGTGHLPRLLRPGAIDGLIPAIAAALILYGVLNSRALERFFSGHVPTFLGRVSFPLYLIHVPMLYTVFAAFYVWYRPASNVFLVGYLLVFLAVSLGLAFLGELFVDGPIVRSIAKAKRRIRGLGVPTTTKR